MSAVRRSRAFLALVLFFFCGFASHTATAQGVFIATGSMNVARFGHTATTLNDGRVLIAGGQDVNDVGLSSVELYDPATGTFTTTGSLGTPRWYFTATRLLGGQVLFAGGFTNGNALGIATCEVYDPTTGFFTVVGSMTGGSRLGHTATLLNNGKVLIAGGSSDGGYTTLASAELYDPATGLFTPTGNMTTARTAAAATLLNNNLVLIAGGSIDRQSAELYDPTTGVFSPTGGMTTRRNQPLATLLSNGKVLFISSGVQTTELYDPTTGTFAGTGSLIQYRSFETSSLLNSGLVLVAGGEFGFGITDFLSESELYDPNVGTFTATSDMTARRASHAAALLNDSRVLVTGGSDCCVVVHSSAELYVPAGGPIVTISPTSIVFANQTLGTTSPPQTVTLRNTGTENANIQTISLGGTNPGDFAITSTSTCENGTSLAPDDSCTLQFTFTPTALGNRNASVQITDNALNSPQTIGLNGTTASQGLLSISPSSLTFPSQYVGTTGLPQSVTLTNTGNASLSITNVTVSPSDFGILNTCQSSLAANASCVIGVFFDPTTSGSRTGTLTITDSAPDSPQTVSLSGTGQDFSMSTTTSSATIAPGQTATYSMSVSPGGGFNQSVSFSCTGAPSLSTCNVNPSSIVLSGNPVPVTVTVSTTANASLIPADRTNGIPPKDIFVVFLSLATLTLAASLMGPQRQRKRLLPAAFACGLLVLMVSCGGGGGSNGGGSKTGTPTGTYPLTVTGTFTSGNTTLLHNTKLTLVVQQ